MRTTSDTYKSLLADDNSSYELRVTITGGQTYGMEDLKSCSISYGLFPDDKGPAIGGAYSAQVKLEAYTDSSDWPRAASFLIEYRLVSSDGETGSEWLPLGTFYTDTREKSGNATDPVLSISGYDGMVTLDTIWTTHIAEESWPSSWPITAKAAADLLAAGYGITLDSRCSLDDTTAFIGLDDTATARDVLKSIAAGCGGNWCMTPDGKLRLVPLNIDTAHTGEAVTGLAIAGIAVVGTSGREDANVIPSKAVTYGAALVPFDGVKLSAYDGTAAVSSSSAVNTLDAQCDFSDSAIAATAYAAIEGYEYKPFETTGSWLDPAMELGDIAIIGGNYLPIYAWTLTCKKKLFSTIAAPFENETDHEYSALGETQRVMQKTETAIASSEARVNSTIEQTATSIQMTVAENYYNKENSDQIVSGVQSQITQTATSLEASITRTRTEANNAVNEVKSYVRYEEIDGEGTVIVGTTEHPSDFRVSPTQVSACYNGEPVSYWNQNKQVCPKAVEIPSGGSLQIGTFKWQPRTSGNLTLLWVGDTT